MSQCKNPIQCKQEAEWIHNPHKDWNFLVQNVVNGTQGVCYAWPASSMVKGCVLIGKLPEYVTPSDVSIIVNDCRFVTQETGWRRIFKFWRKP